MGLRVSHGCWDGPCRSFLEWRRHVAAVILIDLDNMYGFGKPDGIRWESLKYDPLHILLNHSDCEGEIEIKDLIPLAERLEDILPLLRAIAKPEEMGPFYELCGPAPIALRFAAGLRRAAALGERVEFH